LSARDVIEPVYRPYRLIAARSRHHSCHRPDSDGGEGRLLCRADRHGRAAPGEPLTPVWLRQPKLAWPT